MGLRWHGQLSRGLGGREVERKMKRECERGGRLKSDVLYGVMYLLKVPTHVQGTLSTQNLRFPGEDRGPAATSESKSHRIRYLTLKRT